MKLGFTGTRNGLTVKQAEALYEVFKKYEPTEFRHGDCVGADGEAADLIDILCNGSCKIWMHPPTIPDHRAFKVNLPNTTILPEKDYLPRDYDIVDGSDRLIACPKGKKELVRSGTWTTVRYARKKKKQITIVYPDGTVKEE